MTTRAPVGGASPAALAVLWAAALWAAAACSAPDRPGGDAPASPDAATAAAGLDSLNARLSAAYRRHDPDAYGALYTDSAVFEWPALPPVRGAAALAAMARANWAPLREMDLRLRVAARRVAGDHATEFGAFEQDYRDSTGARYTEFGRYAAAMARRPDGTWRLDRFLGFADSTRAARSAPAPRQAVR